MKFVKVVKSIREVYTVNFNKETSEFEVLLPSGEVIGEVVNVEDVEDLLEGYETCTDEE